jgi:putative acyl-CoA dehydrogenase
MISQNPKDFYQAFPVLKNQYHQDPLLSRYLKTRMPASVFEAISPKLADLGEVVVGDMLKWAQEAEENPPKHVPFDPWGKRIDEIKVSSAWKKMDQVAATHGLIATGYERKYAEHSRMFQMALLYLYHPSSAFYSCPLAMTDGAARAIELHGDENLKKRAFAHLTSRDPQKFWTSGQWMTEKTGGSDVSETQTVAKRDPSKEAGAYLLNGTKWFTSATTSQMALTLARVEGAEGGSRGLSLFYVELRNAQGELQNIRIERLKDKLGTKALPTAELRLENTPAQVVGEEGQGVRRISSVLNITRIYNSVCSIAQMRRGIELATEYAKLRVAFGKRLIEHPLHVQTLSNLQLEWMGCFHLVMKAAELLGKEETGKASENEKALLRLLTPLTKLTCGKSTVAVATEVLECFGGAGYIEDTGLPRLLRDAQVLAIWEGTTNVLSLDMLRAFEKEKGFEALSVDFNTRLKNLKNSKARDVLTEAFTHLAGQFAAQAKLGAEALQGNARNLALTLTRIYMASLLLEFADQTGHAQDLMAASHWMRDRELKFNLKSTDESLLG